LLPPEQRAKMLAGPYIKADVHTSMNIFSSALGKLVSFIDSKLEQMM
jgi:type IV secretion system protein VirD4